MARVVFMGTPQFAVPVLSALAERYEVVGVITQPDRPAGRGRSLTISPVKESALALGLPLFQPPTLRTPEAVECLAESRPEVIVVAAFGQILRPAVLELPPFGCLNVHGSLLPRYRGAAPIPAAILAGDQTTGVTIMRIDEGLDSGPVLAQAELRIAPDDTTGALTAKLSRLGAELLVETLPGWLEGRMQAQPQDAERATFCKPLKKSDGLLNWNRPASELDRQVRACNPWPGAYTLWRGQTFKVLRSRPWPELFEQGLAGRVIALDGRLGVVTGEGVLELVEVQLAGKKPMAVELFVRGQRGMAGGVLGV